METGAESLLVTLQTTQVTFLEFQCPFGLVWVIYLPLASRS
jgi:hypothetical protein